MWLILEAILITIENARIKAKITGDQQTKFDARFGNANRNDAPRIMSVDGSVASIDIQGVLTDQPDIIAYLFGGGNTTYSDIIASIALAEADPNVESIQLNIDSPGGSASMGWVETMKAVANADKPVKVIGGNVVASAAYGIASQADEILAFNEMSKFGSIGVALTATIRENQVTITSSNAPEKAPDPGTDEGVQAIQKMLDPAAEIFTGYVAEGRGVSTKTVNADFGRGNIVFAENALTKKMIDGFLNAESAQSLNSSNNLSARKGGETAEEARMSPEELKAKHPALYNQIFGLGREAGVKAERERSEAFLALGALSPKGMELAIEAIKKGDEITPATHIQYMTAAQAQQATDDSVEESETVDADAQDPTSDLDASDSNDLTSLADETLEVINKKFGPVKSEVE